MKKITSMKKPVNYCFRIVKRLSRDEKKELINKIQNSIVERQEWKAMELEKNGKDIWTGFTPDELEAYLRDTGNYYKHTV